MLFVIMCLIFVFAHPTIRKKAYKFFWNVHSLYVLLYLLCLIHGLARLTGPPRFWLFFIGPAIVYTLDKIVSLRTKYMALDVIETNLLPSDVIKIKFYRPPNLKYLSGQWVRLACTAFSSNEMHSFTLTSAPHENCLSCHIKAHGPWTWKLRNYFDPCNYNPEDQPKLRIEGPFGGGNQDWYKFEVAVMVGGGIGVTPYASILNDLVFGTSTNRYSGVACKKVYFLWICPSHKHFEWFIDVLRDVEKKDVTNVLEIHIFITQFFHKFDLRTTMLVKYDFNRNYINVLSALLFLVYLWEPLSTTIKNINVHWIEGCKSFWTAWYVQLPEIRSKKAFLCKCTYIDLRIIFQIWIKNWNVTNVFIGFQDWCILVWTSSAY